MSLNQGKPSAMDLRWRQRRAKRENDIHNRSNYKRWCEFEVSRRMERELLRIMRSKEAEERLSTLMVGVDYGGPTDDASMVVLIRRSVAGLSEVVFCRNAEVDLETLLKEIGEIYDAEIADTDRRR